MLFEKGKVILFQYKGKGKMSKSPLGGKNIQNNFKKELQKLSKKKFIVYCAKGQKKNVFFKPWASTFAEF